MDAFQSCHTEIMTSFQHTLHEILVLSHQCTTKAKANLRTSAGSHEPAMISRVPAHQIQWFYFDFNRYGNNTFIVQSIENNQTKSLKDNSAWWLRRQTRISLYFRIRVLQWRSYSCHVLSEDLWEVSWTRQCFDWLKKEWPTKNILIARKTCSSVYVAMIL